MKYDKTAWLPFQMESLINFKKNIATLHKANCVKLKYSYFTNNSYPNTKTYQLSYEL